VQDLVGTNASRHGGKATRATSGATVKSGHHTAGPDSLPSLTFHQ